MRQVIKLAVHNLQFGIRILISPASENLIQYLKTLIEKLFFILSKIDQNIEDFFSFFKSGRNNILSQRKSN